MPEERLEEWSIAMPRKPVFLAAFVNLALPAHISTMIKSEICFPLHFCETDFTDLPCMVLERLCTDSARFFAMFSSSLVSRFAGE